jgi:hypothetical protein
MYFSTQVAVLAAASLVSGSPSVVKPRQSQKVTVDLSKKYQVIDGRASSS